MSQQLPLASRPRLGSKPRLGYSASAIDRAAPMRADALLTLINQPEARAYVTAGEMIVLNKGAEFHDPLFSVANTQEIGEARETVFIGLHGNSPRFGIAVDPTAAEILKQRQEFVVTDLRSIAVNGLVAPEHLAPLAEAKALLAWHRRHRFCPNCGAPSTLIEGGWRRDCTACNTQHFPRTDPVVIMLPFAGDQCVLGRSYRFVPGMWSCLAGFMEPGETIEEAVRRETPRKPASSTNGQLFCIAAVAVSDIAHDWLLAEALSRKKIIDRSELEGARWFHRDKFLACSCACIRTA